MKGDESLDKASTKKAGFLSRHEDGAAALKMPERAKKILQKKGVKIAANYFFVLLSFIIPFVLMAMAFASLNIHGFTSDGDQQFLVSDGWHQYFPFLQEMQDKIQSGGSLLYTLRSGLGTNFLSVMSYYTASPLNFITLFIPTEYLRDVLALFVCIKVGCAGLFMSLFLRGTFKRNDFSIVLFSIPYALCGYLMVFYWNIMWLDTVVIAPLVFLGTYALVREGRYKTYVIALAIAFFSNYYIGYMVCVFVAIMFFAVNVILRPSVKQFFKRLGQIALYTVISLGITAVLELPMIFSLAKTYSAGSTFPQTTKFYKTVAELLSNVLAFSDLAGSDEASPARVNQINLYCGLLAILLLGVLIMCNRISMREKIVYIVVVGFLILSCNYNILDYIWHGFHFPNQIPARFSFLFAFAVLAIGYRAFTKLDKSHWMSIIGGAVVLVILLYIAKLAGVSDSTFKGNLFLGLGYLVCLALVAFRFLNTKAIAFILLFPMVFELNANVKEATQAVGSSSYESYFSSRDDIDKLVDEYGSSDDSFYRMETLFQDEGNPRTINNPALFQYRGVSIFSSMVNSETTQYIKNLGLLASRAGNRYYYTRTTPFINAVLNIKYTMWVSGELPADTKYNKLIDTEGSVKLYENEAYLPLGFMCEDDIENMDIISTIPFYYQNQLFKAMTGIDKYIFYYVPLTSTDGCANLAVTSEEKNTGTHTYEPDGSNTGANGTLSLKYTVGKDGWYYGCFKFDQIDSISITTTNSQNPIQTLALKSTMPYACQIGYLKAGETVTITGTTKNKPEGKNTFTSCVYRLDDEAFDEGLEKLRSNGTLDVTSVSDTEIKGNIKVNHGGIMYTSIPYEKGWSVYVNGEKQDAAAVCNNTYNENGVKTHAGSMLGIRLDEGEYEIELKYSPEGFTAGIVISIVSLAAFIALIIYNRRRAKSGKVIYDIILSPEERKEQDAKGRSGGKNQKDISDEEIDFSKKIKKK